MSEQTGIEWCDHTFNIAWGCMKVSPGCKHCYADTLTERFPWVVDGKEVPVWGPPSTTARRVFGPKHWNDPLRWNRKAAKAGKRARVFCSSMCDVFEDHPTIDAERAKLWPLIRATPSLDWLILTKRPERITANLPDDWTWRYGYHNVWLGTSIESQEYVERGKILAAVPARVRFLSIEPMIGPVVLQPVMLNGGQFGEGVGSYIDWVIGGGESGPNARPCETDWLRALRDECAWEEVPFFLKQLGGYPDKRGHEKAVLDGKRYVEWPVPRTDEDASDTDSGTCEGCVAGVPNHQCRDL